MRSASSQPRDDAADLRDAAEVLGELAAPDRRFDRLARLAGALLDAPAAGISVVASGRVVHLGLHAPDGAPEVEASFLGRCAADGLHDDVDARGDADLAWRLGVPLPGAGRAPPCVAGRSTRAPRRGRRARSGRVVKAANNKAFPGLPGVAGCLCYARHFRVRTPPGARPGRSLCLRLRPPVRSAAILLNPYTQGK